MSEEENPDIVEKEMTPLECMRHSAAHVLAEAVLQVFPEAKLGIGPPIENGFYYDFDLPRSLEPEDLERIEQGMLQSIGANKTFERRPVSKEEALALFKDQPYKLELIEEFGDGNLSVYQHGEFVDLCRGPHVESTGQLGPFRLGPVAGAYWRGSEKNPMLQRIYGTMFETEEALEQHLVNLELARERDHRRLGKELGLFAFSPEWIGSGIPLFLPKGEMLRHLMEDYVREVQTRHGYEHVWTAHIAKEQLYVRSGHIPLYLGEQFPPMVAEDGERFKLKPMNCPSHMTLFNTQYHSYRDLPVRYAEFCTLYRFEKSGELSGLTRVRSLTQDDCHIFCTPEQIQEEFARALGVITEVMNTYGFHDYKVDLSIPKEFDPDIHAGSAEDWEQATKALKQALDTLGVHYDVAFGEETFYGPKADFMTRDVLGRQWQLSTVQVDFIMPKRIGCEYIGEDGQPHTPVVLHRAVTGSTERTMGILIEHFGGAFPTWLSPVQAIVLPIADRHVGYAQRVAAMLREAGVRVEVDARSERLNLKKREALIQKIPYILVVGNKEEENNAVAVSVRGGPELGAIPLEEFRGNIRRDIETKALSPIES